MSAIVRRILFLSLALVLCFAFVGCVEKEATLTPEQIDQIITEAASATAEVNTYQLDMDMSMTMEVTGGAEPGTMSLDADVTGAIDNVNKEMQMIMTMTVNVPELGEQTWDMDIYIIGEWMYMRMDVPEMGEQWVKMELTPEMWEMQKQVEQQIEMLETATEVKLLRSEVADGVDCYVFGITPDIGKLVEYLSQQPGMEAIGLEEIEALEELFEKMSISMEEWIAKDSSLLTKAEAHMFMELTPEDVGVTEEEFEKMTMDINMGMVAYDYNQPVSIELPPEALEAPEMPVM